MCGHYGSGKTNVAINLALAAKRQSPNRTVSVADVDIVNPYFRTADAAETLKKEGIVPLIPEFANSNVDIPSLPHRLTALFSDPLETELAFIDVGGDEGAVALGRYRRFLNEGAYDMLYVVSQYRPLTAKPEEAAALMRDIEAVSGLRCTMLVNNSSLGAETTEEDVVDSVSYAKECAKRCALPLFCHAYYQSLLPGLPAVFQRAGLSDEPLFPMRNMTKQLF